MLRDTPTFVHTANIATGVVGSLSRTRFRSDLVIAHIAEIQGFKHGELLLCIMCRCRVCLLRSGQLTQAYTCTSTYTYIYVYCIC